MIKRREFLGITAMTGIAATLKPLETLSTPLTSKTLPGYNLSVMATNWGFGGSIEEFVKKIKEAGYDGAEIWISGTPEEASKIKKLFDDNELKLGWMAGGWDAKVEDHFNQFKEQLDRALSTKPMYVNCHSGRDHYTLEQNNRFIEYTNEQAKKSGIPIYHETHRSRMLFACHAAPPFIQKYKELKITLDISHWCNVAESLLWDQGKAVEETLSRTEHIHARIGHPEGPQVNDPRAPEWENAVKAHFDWWDKVVERKRKLGQSMTILTEFGPSDYLPALPYTRQPVANQWEINVYMLKVLKERYS